MEKFEELIENNKSLFFESFGIKLDGRFDGKFVFLEVEDYINNNIIICCCYGLLKIGE